MKQARRLGLVALLLLAALSTLGGLVGGPPKVIQFGKVRDCAKGRPIPEARVLAIYAGSSSAKVGPSILETVTDSAGGYALSLWGQAWVPYSATGYDSVRCVYPNNPVECNLSCGVINDDRS